MQHETILHEGTMLRKGMIHMRRMLCGECHSARATRWDKGTMPCEGRKLCERMIYVGRMLRERMMLRE